jgi:hypothetical protein
MAEFRFTEKQAATILNYKKVVGGRFVSKNNLKNVLLFLRKSFLS